MCKYKNLYCMYTFIVCIYKYMNKWVLRNWEFSYLRKLNKRFQHTLNRIFSGEYLNLGRGNNWRVVAEIFFIEKNKCIFTPKKRNETCIRLTTIQMHLDTSSTTEKRWCGENKETMKWIITHKGKCLSVAKIE